MNEVQAYGYYPGCSLASSAKEYDLSVRAVFAHLGLPLVEIEDWNCCGAVHGDVNDAEAGLVLPARNLALAESQGFSVVIAPCSGCYRNLRRASKRLDADRTVREKVNARLKGGLNVTSHIEVMHPLYLLLRDYGLDRIAAAVSNPLDGLRVASYYGCMLTRPRDVFDSPERPAGLDDLVRVLGAQPVDYPMRAKCCGGALAISHSDVTVHLTGDILKSARQAEADIVMLACPMCHTALDGYQEKVERAQHEHLGLPVLYFTQVMGLAFGLDPRQLGFERHMVSPRPQLAKLGF
ncbi:MAG TPA: heterodisulfide reductase subunit B [Chloroflexi bacterium]|nr:heterodisulfide reductase subunit B [Chloroflexota bacterium]